MPKELTIALGKAIQKITKIRHGGSALSGLIIEKIDSNFVPSILNNLKYGVVLISGTNGKTTTTKMVVQVLQDQGIKVFSNKSGSNFIRGVAAALLSEVDTSGKLDADIAVLELDEAHAVKFSQIVKPRYSLFLNVMRDQLDRFGEIDQTANLLLKVAQNTSDCVVLNREDPRLVSFASSLKNKKVSYFGLNYNLLKYFPSDENLRSNKIPKQFSNIKADVVLEDFSDSYATFIVDKKKYKVKLSLKGLYNIFNSAAAMALSIQVLQKNININKLLLTLSEIKPAFGRGESITIGGKNLEIILVKNPSGFRLGLKSFDPANTATMIAINDNYADGRDMSWLWDVDFTSLKKGGVSHVSGLRCYDMALRLQYDEVPISDVNQNLSNSLQSFLDSNSNSNKRIYATYTAMLALRKELNKIIELEPIS